MRLQEKSFELFGRLPPVLSVGSGKEANSRSTTLTTMCFAGVKTAPHVVVIHPERNLVDRVDLSAKACAALSSTTLLSPRVRHHLLGNRRHEGSSHRQHRSVRRR